MTTPTDARTDEMPLAALEPGRVLRHKYRIERVLGRGGMGQVLAAFHMDLEQRVAIKVLLPELRAHPELVERFLREGKAASRIQGDHVARVLDVDRLEDGTPFLVMEYLEGTDLSSIRRSKTPLPIPDAVDYVVQACSAISRAHARGIIHRDIKPANLFLARADDGSLKIKVLDFGISKLASAIGSSEPGMTRASLVLGSAEYMSPEQMLSARDVDARSDIWALGVVLFELLTAEVPFPGDTLTQICALVMTHPPPRPRSLRRDLPAPLEQIILKCLEKDPAKRFATADALASGLVTALADTALGLGRAPVASPTPVFGAAPLLASHAESSHVARTSVLPGTPVSLPPTAEGAGPEPSAHIADVQRASKASSAVSAAHAASLTGTTHTNAAVASEPLSVPLRKRSLAPWMVATIAVTLLGIGTVASVAVRHAPASSASARPVDRILSTTTSAPSASALPDEVVSVTPLPATPSAAVSAVTTASATPSARKSKGPAPTVVSPRPPTHHDPAVKPMQTSGID